MTDREKPVLLVVDECEVRCLLQDIYFSEFGMNVESVNEGAAAVARCSALAPDVALVSMSLEGELDAVETIRGLKARSGTHIIALADASTSSVDAQVEHAARALAAGADMLVVKPCMPDTLLRHVKRLLAHRQPDAGRDAASDDRRSQELGGEARADGDEAVSLGMSA
ncbi:MAG: response regulator [Labilithrix sp.]|nr:response regulator [Labilithrix sp.]MCW5835647.1 response regulator [Labilithrix sp.]